MASPDWDAENPYASPRSIDEWPAQDEIDEDLDRFVIEPWLASRDGIDVLSSLLLCLEAAVVLGLVFAVCGIAAYGWLPDEVGVYVGLAGAFILLQAGGIYELLCRVRRLRVDAAGIAFGRRLGKPKFLAWGQIRGIRPATRSEVFIHAWLWLWLEPTKSESTAGHYRIEWDDGCRFFPPKDPALFENAIRKFCPHLLVHE